MTFVEENVKVVTEASDCANPGAERVTGELCAVLVALKRKHAELQVAEQRVP